MGSKSKATMRPLPVGMSRIAGLPASSFPPLIPPLTTRAGSSGFWSFGGVTPFAFALSFSRSFSVSSSSANAGSLSGFVP